MFNVIFIFKISGSKWLKPGAFRILNSYSNQDKPQKVPRAQQLQMISKIKIKNKYKKCQYADNKYRKIWKQPTSKILCT